MTYKRVDKLFLRLWVLVFGLLMYQALSPYKSLIPREKVFSHNVVAVTLPLLTQVNNKAQLAAIIGHEIAHIQLKHTTSNKHGMTMEYDSDLMSVFYMKKAGYNICEAKLFWESSAGEYLELNPKSHPNAQTRAYYMTFPECKNYKSKKQEVTLEDAREVFDKMNKFVAGIDRYRTEFRVILITDQVNAYAWTVMKEKQ